MDCGSWIRGKIINIIRGIPPYPNDPRTIKRSSHPRCLNTLIAQSIDPPSWCALRDCTKGLEGIDPSAPRDTLIQRCLIPWVYDDCLRLHDYSSPYEKSNSHRNSISNPQNSPSQCTWNIIIISSYVIEPFILILWDETLVKRAVHSKRMNGSVEPTGHSAVRRPPSAVRRSQPHPPPLTSPRPSIVAGKCCRTADLNVKSPLHDCTRSE